MEYKWAWAPAETAVYYGPTFLEFLLDGMYGYISQRWLTVDYIGGSRLATRDAARQLISDGWMTEMADQALAFSYMGSSDRAVEIITRMLERIAREAYRIDLERRCFESGLM